VTEEDALSLALPFLSRVNTHDFPLDMSFIVTSNVPIIESCTMLFKMLFPGRKFSMDRTDLALTASIESLQSQRATYDEFKTTFDFKAVENLTSSFVIKHCLTEF